MYIPGGKVLPGFNSNLNREIVKVENTFQLSEVQNEMFANIGVTFAVAELDADAALEDFARAVTIRQPNQETGELEDVTSWNLWDSGMSVVKQAYAGKKGVTLDSDTIKSMTKRFYRRLEEMYGLTKPAKPSESGQQKAAQRSKAQAALDELKAKSYDELQTEMANLLAKPSTETLAAAGKVAKAIKAKETDEKKDRMTEIKAKQSEVGKLAKQCLDEDILEECLELLAANIIIQ
jgi:hypothetical protein